MKKLNPDLLIVGAGLSGLLTAYALAELNKNIVILDKYDFSNQKFLLNDFRTTAIAEGSKEFLEKINLWSKIKAKAEPIKDIQIFDRSPERVINFRNKFKNKNLGYIIKNSIIKKIILKSIRNNKKIKFVTNSEIKKILKKEKKIVCRTNNHIINSELLIAADGKNSGVGKLLNASIYKKNYKHKAVVINFLHNKNHYNIAHEFFFKDGPLAILPMKKTKSPYYSSSVIWSNKIKYANSLLSLKKNILSKLLEEKIYKYVGNVTKIINIQGFSLSAHINKKFFDDRTIYVGDSAHSIHPIAGQGWNLAVRDIKQCLSILKKSKALGLDLGSKYVCSQYHDNTFYDSYSLYQITDKLNSIFLTENFALNNFRRIGFRSIENNQKLKNFITNFAMGF